MGYIPSGNNYIHSKQNSRLQCGLPCSVLTSPRCTPRHACDTACSDSVPLEADAWARKDVHNNHKNAREMFDGQNVAMPCTTLKHKQATFIQHVAKVSLVHIRFPYIPHDRTNHCCYLRSVHLAHVNIKDLYHCHWSSLLTLFNEIKLSSS